MKHIHYRKQKIKTKRKITPNSILQKISTIKQMLLHCKWDNFLCKFGRKYIFKYLLKEQIICLLSEKLKMYFVNFTWILIFSCTFFSRHWKPISFEVPFPGYRLYSRFHVSLSSIRLIMSLYLEGIVKMLVNMICDVT